MSCGCLNAPPLHWLLYTSLYRQCRSRPPLTACRRPILLCTAVVLRSSDHPVLEELCRRAKANRTQLQSAHNPSQTEEKAWARLAREYADQKVC